ncbi:hypothetical protein TNCV_2235361 [Trichonephila clavipes]|nr:hypothetical protein TNCV_2235361 [Trichonephila clavipes]
MYVDDWITGQDTREEALFMSHHAKNFMKEAGMEMRKWISNDTTLMAHGRQKEIPKLTDPDSWFHCSGQDNPSDFLSRGLSVDTLTSNSKWWNGPAFQRTDELPETASECPELNEKTVSLYPNTKELFGLIHDFFILYSGAKKRNERLASLGNGTHSVPPSHIEMYLGLESERPGLRASFLICGLEGARGSGYGDCFGDLRCHEICSDKADERHVCYSLNRISEFALYRLS